MPFECRVLVNKHHGMFDAAYYPMRDAPRRR